MTFDIESLARIHADADATCAKITAKRCISPAQDQLHTSALTAAHEAMDAIIAAPIADETDAVIVAELIAQQFNTAALERGKPAEPIGRLLDKLSRYIAV